MTNAEKYKTAEERIEAFSKFRTRCEFCKFKKECSWEETECAIRWLDLEAEADKPLPCPFCGEECTATVMQNEWRVSCIVSGCYRSSFFGTESEAIAAHNRVAKAVMEIEAKHD